MRAFASCKLYKTSITPSSQSHALLTNRKITISSTIRNSFAPQKNCFITSFGLKPRFKKSFFTTSVPSITKDEHNSQPPEAILSTTEQPQTTNQEKQIEQVIKIEHVTDDAWVEKIKNLDEQATDQTLHEVLNILKSTYVKIGLSEYDKLVKLSFKRMYPRPDEFLFILDHAIQNDVELPSDIIGKCFVGYSYSKSAQSTNILGRIAEFKMKNMQPHPFWHEAAIRCYCGEKATDAIKKYLAENELVLEDSHLKLAIAACYLVQGKKEDFIETLVSIKSSLKETLWEELLTELTVKHEAPQEIVQFREQMMSEQTGISFKLIQDLLQYLHDTKRDEIWIKLFIAELQLQIRASQSQMDLYLQKLDNLWNQRKRVSHGSVILSAIQNRLIDIKDEPFLEKMVQYFGKWNEMEVVKSLVHQHTSLVRQVPGISFHKAVLEAYHADSDVIGAFAYWDRLSNNEASQLLSQITQIMIESAELAQLERFNHALEKKRFPTLDQQVEVHERLVTIAAKRGYMKNLVEYIRKLQELDSLVPVHLSAMVVPVLVKRAEWKLASELVSDLKQQVGYKTQGREGLSQASQEALQLLLKGEVKQDDKETQEEPTPVEDEDAHSSLSPEDTITAFNTILFRELYFPKDKDWKHTLAQMQQRKIPVSLACFNEILRFCLKKKFPMEDTWQYYDLMEVQGVTPDVDTFGLLRTMTRSLPNFFWSIPITIRDKLRMSEKLTTGEVEKLTKSLKKARNEMEIAKAKQTELDMVMDETTQEQDEESKEATEEATEGITEAVMEVTTEQSPSSSKSTPSNSDTSVPASAENPPSFENVSTPIESPATPIETPAVTEDTAPVPNADTTSTTLTSVDTSSESPSSEQK